MGSLLETLRAQDAAAETIRRALRTRRVHHAYLFDGPDGVGKELAAFALAQALVCAQPREDGEACGTCSACVRSAPDPKTRRPKHPDIVVLERALYEPAQIGRRTPETQDLSIDQVRTLVLSHAAYAPHEGRARVFIVRRAEELSIAAANALLKTLEEPIDKMHFILLTSQPDALLPTILSRVQRVRFAPLGEPVVVALLTERGVAREVAERVAPLSDGSMEAALALCDEDATAAREAFVASALEAMEGRTLAATLDLGEREKRDKVTLRTNLLALAARLAQVAKSGDERFAERYAHVLQALRDLDANASPQLTIESLFVRMRLG
ncbi:MAG TPA: DNA polymerase III subunit delta' [Polyangiaceae bacterium]|jgi:DNA polymerase-3 subunit delta'